MKISLLYFINILFIIIVISNAEKYSCNSSEIIKPSEFIGKCFIMNILFFIFVAVIGLFLGLD
tara:strand:- start:223 stop:411 length:189 start_codon:yes stop_codon:yes gene_type:complete